MLDKWLAILPKGFVAFVAIALGIVLIVFSDPPKTVCDAQIEIFKEEQKGFLYPKDGEPPMLPDLVKFCKSSAGPGGCYELFKHLKKMLSDLRSVPHECQEQVGEVENLRPIVFSSLDLLVRLAWGEKPPVNVGLKYGWLDVADMSLFCSLKEAAARYWGDQTWGRFRERYFKELPGSDQLSRERVWELTILSSECSQFPK